MKYKKTTKTKVFIRILSLLVLMFIVLLSTLGFTELIKNVSAGKTMFYGILLIIIIRETVNITTDIFY